MDSRPFQRLRQIHQLALTYLVYPGASHKRFEHSLGVMELADRVFHIVTHPNNLTDDIRAIIPEISETDKRAYWRSVLRMAALCHDLGHLPFSHAAEEVLLPNGCNHESLTIEIIRSDEMQAIWQQMTPPLRSDDIVKLAVGQKGARDLAFTDLESILAEIIVGDVFGVDRIDYLLRDSYHTGVAYGRFDHNRLIDTMRILPSPPSSADHQSKEPTLGVEEGGLHSAEALLLARYFMYSQVYFHPIRRIYDIHLRDFLTSFLPTGTFPTEIEAHLEMTDNEVLSALREAAANSTKKGHKYARRIMKREHFKLLYQRNPDDIRRNPDAVQSIYAGVSKEFGKEYIEIDTYAQSGGILDFPILGSDSPALGFCWTLD